ncbi:MAG: HAD-IA family hydrolase [Cohaesibacteraceae bacterium]|nr:HAD-IA family hydrolase [Cohaesibacteraceae bacterium]
MLIIFDCDGVLVDSEIIASKVVSGYYTKEGYEISASQFAEKFAGMTGKEAFEFVETELGRHMPEDLLNKIEDEIDRRLAKEVKIIEGADLVLDQLDDARCICSNSHSNRLEITLRKTGLFDRFRPYIFSSLEVGTKAPKPDPNVFLHAAKEFDTKPSDCIVIEDSAAGVKAACAAGMRVIGFTGGSHTYQSHSDILTEAGAETVVRRHREMAATIEALKSWSGF